jgi:glycosyltransferase involved in cell wall biosynthesis
MPLYVEMRTSMTTATLSLAMVGLALLTLLLWVVVAAWAVPDLYRMPRLDRFPVAEQPPSVVPSGAPRVSVVIAGRDEGAKLGRTLEGLTAQSLRDIEVIVVDDRSSDNTPDLLRRWADADERIRVIRIDTLPPGWLGKNHALHRGAAAARGEWLVFMDADVAADPDLLVRALVWCEQRSLDVLTLAPQLKPSSWWLAALMRVFVLNFVLFLRPQRAHRRHSRASAGIGAFMMMRRGVYLRCGGHEPVRMRVDDDAALGKWLKRCGAQEQMVFAGRLCSLEWYGSVTDMMRGMEKNPLAAFAYRPWALALCIPLLLWIYVGPWLCLLAGPPSARVLGALGCVFITILSCFLQPLFENAHLRDVMQWPFGAVLLAYAYLRAALLAWRRGTLLWRDTAYPLRELRENRRIGPPGLTT